LFTFETNWLNVVFVFIASDYVFPLLLTFTYVQLSDMTPLFLTNKCSYPNSNRTILTTGISFCKYHLRNPYSRFVNLAVFILCRNV